MARRAQTDNVRFDGFDRPESNWFRMPNSWTDITAGINSIAELKVVEYILRHTWGYHEYGIKKHITIDEFVNGRRREDGSRMDRGTGLSERAVYDGLRLAKQGGLIEEEVDTSDRGRIKKSYSLRMRQQQAPADGLQTLQPGVQNLHPPLQNMHPPLQDLPPRGANSIPRSEKDTQERHDISSNIRRAQPIVDNSPMRQTGSRASQPAAVGQVLETLPAGAAISRWRRDHEATDPGEPEETENAAAVTAQRQAPGGRPAVRRRSPVRKRVYDEDRQVLVAFMDDFAREFQDRAPLSASVSRAYNLLRSSGLGRDAFLDRLYEARAITKERSAGIRSRAGTDSVGLPVKAKMPFFFAVLEDLLGLKSDAAAAVDRAAPTD